MKKKDVYKRQRMLFDSKKLYEDQLAALERDRKRVGNAGDHIDYALLCDGLTADREQGITTVSYTHLDVYKRQEKRSEEKLAKWIKDKQKHTYVRINEKWQKCDFKYPGWVNK